MVEASFYVFVHSRSSKQRLDEAGFDSKVQLVPFPCEFKATDPHPQIQAESNRLHLASLGLVTPTKQIPMEIHALATIRESLPPFRYHLVGEVSDRPKLDALLRRTGLEEQVKIWGYVSFEDLNRIAASVDIVVGLRYPSAGETSAALFRALAEGKTNVVFDYASYADVPDGVLCKVPLSSDSTRMLAEALLELGSNPRRREEINRRAVAYASLLHAHTHAARLMRDSIREVMDA